MNLTPEQIEECRAELRCEATEDDEYNTLCDMALRATEERVVLVGEYTIATLRRGQEVRLNCGVTLMSASDLTATKWPTEAMLIAARDWSSDKYGKPIGNEAATLCWQAMLSAVPEKESMSVQAIVDCNADLLRENESLRELLIELPGLDAEGTIPQRDYVGMSPADCYDLGLMDGAMTMRAAIRTRLYEERILGADEANVLISQENQT